VTRDPALLRLASFNLMSGRSLPGGLIDPAMLRDAVTELDADVLALQEVDRYQPRSGSADQASVIAESMSAAARRFAETVHGSPGVAGWLPGRELIPDGDTTPGYGVALLSRIPVLEWHSLRLAPARGRFPIPIPSRPVQVLWLRDEPRVAVAAVLEEPRITIACTHLSFVPHVSMRQLRLVKRWLATLPGPRVLLGDLNLPAGPVRRITRWTPLVTAPTFPSPAPRIQLDHLLADGLPPHQGPGHVVRLAVSDHLAAVADLRL
jgi:endonuclease/exonuclease/phosphatase family metal-dependent hydrolase